MLKNYLTVALRNLLRHKLYSTINIFGLAVGMACVILITLFINNELNYDGFQEKGHRIYRVLRETRSDDGSKIVHAGTSGPLGQKLQDDFPEVEQYVRKMSWDQIWVQVGDKGFPKSFCYADPNFLDIFTFPLVQGDPKTALQKPNAVLITEETAQIYFDDRDPIGQTITVSDRYYGGVYEITGVLKNIPKRSYFRFDFLSVSPNPQTRGARYFQNEHFNETGSFFPITNYILLSEHATVSDLEKKLPDFMIRYMGEEVSERNTYYLQRFDRIYLHTTADYGAVYSIVDRHLPLGDIRQIHAFIAVAGFILLIACINFMNLTTARSANRAREVGLRKVVGAHKKHLIQQFIGETILLAFFALLIAVTLAYLALPAFNAFVQKELSLTPTLFGIASLIGFTLLVGVVSGSYPALFLSSFQPVTILKNVTEQGGAWIRKTLVIFQFGISIVMLIGTGIVYNQMQYITNKKLGFNKAQTITLPLTASRLGPRIIEREFLQHPDVLSVTRHNYFLYSQQYETVHTGNFEESQQRMYMISGNQPFLETFGLEVIQGRDFSNDHPTDRIEAVILNETAVKKLGWDDDPIGKTLHWHHRPNMRVIGVVKDFHIKSLHQEIQPAFIVKDYKFKWYTLKVRTDNLPEVMTFLENKWNQLAPHFPFTYTFVDEYVDQLYKNEKRLGQTFGTFSLLAIFVSCLGLFGLSAFTAEQRTKEIGIRKVLGASALGITLNLSRDIIKLVLISNLIAWPVAFYLMNQWLQSFAYRIDLNFTLFILSGIIAFLIAFLTVGYQALKAARANPIDALRYE